MPPPPPPQILPCTGRAPAGFYIAWHPWLDKVARPGALFKVGHTGDLRARLHDSAYATNFAEGWRFWATWETADKEAAQLLETAVLHCCRHHRLDGRELVGLPAAELVALAAAAAAELHEAVGAVVFREGPVYPPAPRRAGGAAAAGEAPLPPTAWAQCAPRVESLTVPPPNAAALVDELLGGVWDFGAIERALPPRPAPRPAAEGPAAGAPPSPAPQAAEAPAKAKAGKGGAAPGAAGEDLAADEVEDVGLADALEAVAGVPREYRLQPVEPRGYQQEAIQRCLEELAASERTILQMACRCGKTPVAYGVICAHLADGKSAALLLVPGLSLLRQTAQKLAAYGHAGPLLLVGSDPRPVMVPGAPAPRELSMTTDRAAIAEFLARPGARLVLSTYQSSPLIPTDAFALTVFDECHRVCGGAAPRPFSHHLQAPRRGRRLFMTATPVLDPPAKVAITMKDREAFGGVAFRYYLRQGIQAGYANDFRLEVVAAPAGAEPGEAGLLAALPAQLHAALGQVDKLLVFCRDIGHAERLCAALAAAPLPPGVAPFESLCAHSRQKAGAAVATLRRFAAPGARAALFSVRMFQEGVELPELNAVFFAAPRHSPRDIIQSVCRPLNRVPGKPPSVVYLPVLHDPRRAPADPENLERYASIVPFIDALLDEDPRLYEHLLDPEACAFPISLLGAHTLALPADPAARASAQAKLLDAVRHAVRYKGSQAKRPVERLLKAKRIPWEHGFRELQRVVRECNRYPKTTDVIVVGKAKASLHAVYRHYADEFTAWLEGRPCLLEPWQLHALDGLEKWRAYGVPGPYPWAECMGFLEQWLQEQGIDRLRINVNNGGYVGLNASGLERLSGALTCVNQADGRDRAGGAPGSGFTLDPKKQADLDRICAKYGLRWRKERNAAGSLVEGGPRTFIQEAYDRFKRYIKDHGTHDAWVQHHYDGYPLKHRQMEDRGVVEARVAPPRKKPPRKAAAAKEPKAQ